MLCDMLLRVTWLHMVCGASGRWLVSGGIVPSLYTVSRRVWSVMQGRPGNQDQVGHEDQAWCILRIIRMCLLDRRGPC